MKVMCKKILFFGAEVVSSSSFSCCCCALELGCYSQLRHNSACCCCLTNLKLVHVWKEGRFSHHRCQPRISFLTSAHYYYYGGYPGYIPECYFFSWEKNFLLMNLRK